MSKVPPLYSVKHLSEGYREVSEALDALERTCPRAPAVPTTPTGAGLASLKRRLDYDNAMRAYLVLLEEWEGAVERSVKEISQRMSMASRALSAKYVGDVLKLPHKQARSRGFAFANRLAGHRCLRTILASLCQFENGRRAVRPVSQPVRKDWRALENAVKALSRAVDRGLPVTDMASRAGIYGVADVTLAAFLRRVESRQERATKAHNDKYTQQRLACKHFAYAIFHEFDGQVPPTWVQRFGNLLGYDSEKLTRTYIKQWCEDWSPDAVQSTPPLSIKKRRNPAG